jgi:hypothetical protein
MRKAGGLGRTILSMAAVAIGGAGLSLIASTPAHAEKTAEQIKCEEEGGTWSDKGNGKTFCFKKLPPMSKAGPVGQGGSDNDCDDSVAAASAKAVGYDLKSSKGRSAGGAPAACRHAIRTKGTGASGRSATDEK